MNKISFAAIALCACVSVHALGQLSPQSAEAGTATTVNTGSLSREIEGVLGRYTDVKSVKIVLETDKNIEDKAVRLELVMTSDRRFAQRFWNLASGSEGDESSLYREDNVQYFAFCDHEYLKARRGLLDMYIRHEANVGWQPAPGPTCIALAPWPVLRAVATSVPGALSVAKSDAGSTLTLGDTKHLLTFGTDETLKTWATDPGPLAEVTEYVDAAADQGSVSIPKKIVQRYPGRGENSSVKTVEWRVVSASINPSDAEQRLDFAPVAAKFKRFDPDTGDITNPDGSIAGREIQPAAMAVDAWDRHTRTKAWSAVFKWGSIATGMFVLAFVMELIRRRL